MLWNIGHTSEPLAVSGGSLWPMALVCVSQWNAEHVSAESYWEGRDHSTATAAASPAPHCT